MTATCVYRLLEPATLRVELSAVSDRPTIVNLTQHSYFNLDGSPDILDHEVTLFADFYTPVDADLIPTGEIRAVAGTPYDFRQPRTAPRSELDALRHQFCRVAPARGGRWSGANRDRAFDEEWPHDEFVLSEPGVQFYSAAPLNCPAPGLDGPHYGAHAGLALEPQAFPDLPNRRHFTDCVLWPDDEYLHDSEFRFA